MTERPPLMWRPPQVHAARQAYRLRGERRQPPRQAIAAFASRTYPDELRRVGRRWAIAVGMTALGFAFIVVPGSIADSSSILGGHATSVAGAGVGILVLLRASRLRAAGGDLLLLMALVLVRSSVVLLGGR